MPAETRICINSLTPDQLDLAVAALTRHSRIGKCCQLEMARDRISVLYPAGFPKQRALDDVWHALWAIQWPFFAPPNDGTWNHACIDPSQLEIDDPGGVREQAGRLAPPKLLKRIVKGQLAWFEA